MKTILITGATDGIGLETVKMLAKKGHRCIIHGRNETKLMKVCEILKEINPEVELISIQSDLSILAEVHQMVEEIVKLNVQLDGIINNAGVFVTPNPSTVDHIDVRFAVNTIAPYILTKKLLPYLNPQGRIVNVASAAQTDVNVNSFAAINLAQEAYAQSKLALIMWSMELEKLTKYNIISVNPKSFLGSKMVKEAYGRQGYDLSIGADILVRAMLDDEFKEASGQYYDNDIKAFARPHHFALDEMNRKKLIENLDQFI